MMERMTERALVEPADEPPIASDDMIRGVTKLEARNFNAWYGNIQALIDVNLRVLEKRVTAVIGPSGCGKSTLLRCFNRMHEVTLGARTEGEILLDGGNVYLEGVDPTDVRRRVGMVFQKANPFPTMSVYDNVSAGLRLNGVSNRERLDRAVEKALKFSFLWDEVHDRLKESGASLSGGQQQRLCIARALAVEPEVILMDEPCSALDPVATAKIEQLIVELKKTYTVVVVTHNMQQASRIADYTAFMYLGKLIEFSETVTLFEKPRNQLTERYITGKFG